MLTSGVSRDLIPDSESRLEILKDIEEKLREWQPGSTLLIPTITNSSGQATPIRLDAIEFELRHTKEHLEKLKFNYLELATKHTFLNRLTDPEEWTNLMANVIWTPSDIKTLEIQEIEPAKAELKACKTRLVELNMQLYQVCEQVTRMQETVEAKWTNATKLLSDLYKLHETISNLFSQAHVPLNQFRSIEELDAVIDENGIQLEKKTSAIEHQTLCNAELERLLKAYQNDVANLQAQEEELKVKVDRAQEARQRQAKESAQLAQLCQWYGKMIETVQSLSLTKVEMIRPDYVLVTCGRSPGPVVPVHLTVEPKSGKLAAVQIGSTSHTPKRQWKQAIEAAIEVNDVAGLIRQVLAIAGLNGSLNKQ